MPGKIPAKANPFQAANVVDSAAVTVGAEATNAINVAIRFRDANARNVAERVSVFAYLSTDSHGDNLAATAPNGGVAVGANGVVIPVITDKAFHLVSKADGTVNVVITDSGTPTFYLVLVMPDGSLQVSGAITFA
jgi:hypothetical protein